MDPIVAAAASPAARKRADWRLLLLAMLAAAFVLRSGLFGNALFGEDEQFYILFAGRLLEGAVPYVDVWDRKPFGLFLVYGALRRLGGDPFLVPQLAATACAGGTAFLIARIAARRTGIVPAALAGVFYLLMLSVLGGDIGQTAVFYNLALAAAAALLLRTAPALDRRGDVPRIALAMLLCGLAIQIKTNAGLEGVAFGLVVAARMAPRVPATVLLRRLALFAGLGALPTLVVVAGFWRAGLLDAWWFANVASQPLKTGGWDAEAMARLGRLLVQVSPMVALAAWGARRLPPSPEKTLLLAWFAAGLVDMLAIGNFWTHYALPLAVPAAALAAFAFAQPRLGRWLFAGFALWPALDALVFDRIFNRMTTQDERAVVAAIPPDAPRTCLLTYGLPALYYIRTGACTVTPYLFIDQLFSQAEAHALPVDAATALRQALARRPGTILVAHGAKWQARNRTNDAILARALRAGYRPIAHVAQHPIEYDAVVVWRRRDLPGR